MGRGRKQNGGFRGWGGEGLRASRGTVSIGEDENVLGMGGSDGCTTA